MPLIRDEDIDEVRSRTDILDVVSGHVTLKKAGSLYKGLCPFHQEKTPSFIVNPDRQTYHCFGCGEGGNAVSFVMKTENLDFPEAVHALADRIGFNLRYVEGTGGQPEGVTARVYAANAAALEYFKSALTKDAGRPARDYLNGRGYSEEAVNKFKLGYAPDSWDGLTAYAEKKGFKPAELSTAGLAAKSDKNPDRIYDRFRGRVIFPIIDIRDRVIGFGGRVMGDGTPKYLNSPETPVFHKGKALYALNWAKEHIKEQKEAIIVEGYTDVISVMLAGAENVVATLGTALTADHLNLLSRYTNRVVFVFDADEAGRKAAERGLELMRGFYLGPEFRKFAEFTETKHLDLFVAVLPQGMDPADFAAEQGGEAFKKLVKGALPLIDFCIETAFTAADMASITGRQKAASAVMEIIGILPSQVAREEYLKAAADKLGSSYEALFDEFKKRKSAPRPNVKPQTYSPPSAFRKDPTRTAEREMIKYLLQNQGDDGVLGALEPDLFSHEDLRLIFEAVKTQMADKKKIDAAALLEVLPDQHLRMEVTAMTGEPITSLDVARVEKDLLRRLKEFEIARRITKVKAEMQGVNPALQPDLHDELFSRLLKLEAERRENKTRGD